MTSRLSKIRNVISTRFSRGTSELEMVIKNARHAEEVASDSSTAPLVDNETGFEYDDPTATRDRYERGSRQDLPVGVGPATTDSGLADSAMFGTSQDLSFEGGPASDCASHCSLTDSVPLMFGSWGDVDRSGVVDDGEELPVVDMTAVVDVDDREPLPVEASTSGRRRQRSRSRTRRNQRASSGPTALGANAHGFLDTQSDCGHGSDDFNTSDKQVGQSPQSLRKLSVNSAPPSPGPGYTRFNPPIDGIQCSASSPEISKSDIHNQAAISSLVQMGMDLETAAKSLANDPDVARNVLTVFNETKTQKIVKSKEKSKKITIPQNLPGPEQQYLFDTFGFLRIYFSSTESTGHPFAKAARTLVELRMEYLMDYKQWLQPAAGYDVVMKDVGSNAFNCVRFGKKNVHCCCPTLDINDQARRSNFMSSLARHDSERATIDQNLVAQRFRAGDSRYYCNSKSQYCHVKAQCLKFLHSTYDMTADDVADAMYVAKAHEGYGCFLYDPMVLYKDNGTFAMSKCHFRKSRVNGRVIIEFWFDGDVQLAYRHDFATYLQLLSRTVIVRYYNCRRYVYFVTPIDHIADTYIFKIFPSQTKVIPKCYVFRPLGGEVCNDSYVLRTWRWSTLAAANGTLDPMTARTILVNKAFWEKCVTFCASSPEGRSTVQRALAGGIAFNSRMIVNGSSVSSGPGYTADEVTDIVCAAYFYNYVRSYEMTKTVQTLIKDENDLRACSELSSWKRFLRVQLRGKHRDRTPRMDEGARTAQITQVGEYYESVVNDFSKKRDNVEMASTITRALKKFVAYWKSLSAVQRVHPISLESAVKLFEASDYFEKQYSELVTDVIKSPIKYSLFDDLPDEDMVDTIGVTCTRQSCTRDIRVIANDASRNCLFRALEDAGSGYTADDLFSLIRNNPELEYAASSDTIIAFLDVGKASEVVINFVAYILKRLICVHVADEVLCVRFHGAQPGQDDSVLHLRYTPGVSGGDGHYDGCIAVIPLPPCIQTTVGLKSYTNAESVLQSVSDYEVFATGVEDRHSVPVKKAINPYEMLGSGGYVSRTGLKIAELDSRYHILKNTTKVLDIGGSPGACIQHVIHSSTADVVTCSTGDYDADVLVNSRVTCFSGNAGDILIAANRDSIVTATGVVQCAICDFSVAPDKYDSNIVGLLDAAYAMVTRTLVVGGTYVCKFPSSRESFRPQIAMLSRTFRNVLLVKPLTSRPSSTEFYVVATGYKLFSVSRSIPSVYSSLACFESCRLKSMRRWVDGVSALRAGRSVESIEADAKSIIAMRSLTLPAVASSRCVVRSIKPPDTSRGADARNEPGEHSWRVDADGDRFIPSYIRKSAKPLVAPIVEETSETESETREDTTKPDDTPMKRPDEMPTDVSVPPDLEKKLDPATRDVMLTPPRRNATPIPARSRSRNRLARAVSVAASDSTVLTKTRVYERRTEDKDADTRKWCMSLPDAEPIIHDVHRSAAREYLLYLQNAHMTQIAMHKTVFADTCNLIRRGYKMADDGYSWVDEKGLTVCRSDEREHNSWDYYYCNFGKGEFRRLGERANAPYLVSDYTHCPFESIMFARIAEHSFNMHAVSVKLVQAGPGCGKTTYNLTHHNPDSDVVLFPTKRSRDSFMAAARNKFGTIDKDRYRTIASYFMNPQNRPSTDTLYIDEALMSHPGALLTAISMSQAKLVVMCGDLKQIPFVNRYPEMSLKHTLLSEIFCVTDYLNVSYRCPADVVARITDMYSDGGGPGLKSKNPRKCSVNWKSIISITDVPNIDGAKYLTFTQLEKQSMLDAKFVGVATVHEYQGEQNPVVVVVRLNDKPATDIFNKSEYALVAITRHTDSFTYYSRVQGDALWNMCVAVPTPSAIDAVYINPELTNVGPMVGSGRPSALALSWRNMELSYKTLRVVNARPDTLGCPTLHFVPRFGLYAFNDKRLPRYSRPVIGRNVMCVSSDNPNQKPNIRTINASLKDLPDGTFAIEPHIMSYIALSLLAGMAYKNGHVFILCSHTRVEQIEPEIRMIVEQNALDSLPTPLVIDDSEVVEYEAPAITDVPRNADLSVIQWFVESAIPGVTGVDLSHDQFMIDNSDYVCSPGVVKLDSSKMMPAVRAYDTMKSVLQTCAPPIRDVSIRQNLGAMLRRNLNVPKMAQNVDAARLSGTMLRRFMDAYVSDERSWVLDEPITLSQYEIHEWFEGQEGVSPSQLLDDMQMEQRALNLYDFMIKKAPKPQLTTDAFATYPALQTIVSHPKSVNAIFCPLFKKMKERVLYMLKDHVHIFTDCSPERFAEKLTDTTPPAVLENADVVEIDISKYDKSQGRVALMFECLLMEKLGIDARWVSLWWSCHMSSHVRDRSTGLSADINWQRKSGDASTFLGNTCFLMAVMSRAMNLKSTRMMCFSGDDSVLVGTGVRTQFDYNYFVSMFNLEVKLFDFKSIHFCSKFLLHDTMRWFFVPDPLKLAVKLGRDDLRNPSHVESYRVSFTDSVRQFGSRTIRELLAEAVYDRYSQLLGKCDVEGAIFELYNLTSSFSDLFFIPVGARLNWDVTEYSE